MKYTRILFILSAGLTGFTLFSNISSAQAQNIENGKRVFKRCIACHFTDREANKVGPSLLNIIGRQAGTKHGFRYSPAMIKAGEDGLIWDQETLKNYLHNPRAVIKGTRMTSVRINDDAEIEDLVAYIKSFDSHEK